MTSTDTFSDERVPSGFVTSELIQQLDGPIHHGDGRIEQGPKVLTWGLQHVYDDRELMVVVRHGDRETYSATGSYMETQNTAGWAGHRFDDIGTALVAARDVVLSAGDRSARMGWPSDE